MKIKAFTLLSILISIFGVGFSNNFLPISTLDGQYSCSETSNIYLNEDSNNDDVADYWLYLRNNFRLFLESPLSNYNA